MDTKTYTVCSCPLKVGYTHYAVLTLGCPVHDTGHYGHNVDITEMPWYCSDCEVYL